MAKEKEYRSSFGSSYDKIVTGICNCDVILIVFICLHFEWPYLANIFCELRSGCVTTELVANTGQTCICNDNHCCKSQQYITYGYIMTVLLEY